MISRRFSTLFLTALLATAAVAQPAQPAPAAQQGPPSYTQILEGAQTQPGLLKVHLRAGHYLLEIPADMFGQNLLWHAELAAVPDGVASPGAQIASRVIRFERRGNVVDIRDLSAALDTRAAGSENDPPENDGMLPDHELDPADLAVSEASVPPILLSVEQIAQAPDGAALIDASRLFRGDVPDFSPQDELEEAFYPVAGIDPDRSYIERIVAHPNQVAANTVVTYRLQRTQPSAATVEIRHTLTALPAQPMHPRAFDPRVGYFPVTYLEAGSSREQGTVERTLITRYRLEKKDPSAALSEPVKPIVYYISPEVPVKWRSYMKQGIEDWNRAFEAAGFKNAIRAEDPPSTPDWNPADTRVSVIRWLAQPVENAMGPSIIDPRSGEILAAHVLIYEDVLKLAQSLYYLLASPNDPQARTLPLSDEKIGQMLRYIVSHEVGHTLGLRHNHRASQALSTEQLRDPASADRFGPVASIMSYGRINYVAQPGDGVKRLIAEIGPYDLFAIRWGYTPLDAATERATLERWLDEAGRDPLLAFGGEDDASVVDPTVLTENIGSDRIEAARLGLMNLERSLGALHGAVPNDRSGIELLRSTYTSALRLREGWLAAASKEIGGVVEHRTLRARETQFTRVPVARQREALRFVLSQLKASQTFLPATVLNTYAPIGASDEFVRSQRRLLMRLLSGQVYGQLSDAALLGENAWSLSDYLTELQSGLFEELGQPSVRIDPLRRDLQRLYLATLQDQLAAYNEPVPDSVVRRVQAQTGMSAAVIRLSLSSGQGTDLRAAVRVALGQLGPRLEQAVANSADSTTRAHLEDLRGVLAELPGQ
ncbi:hypothetical protein HNR42_002589 [Deinobacterium chartae]|uniref:Zinc-dependent metalloprotease n=1 Tax=Deinobacterium chartae TaxID=521158 RepID=A0A841I1N4_9DEIO|nr:zinc-dependent metalloprotease [Deinobacterium chartae]MBB6099153.1 hypothetical protein [Deinobacterium chartae]